MHQKDTSAKSTSAKSTFAQKAFRLFMAAVVIFALFVTPAAAQDGAADDEGKMLYALGAALGQQATQFGLTDEEVVKVIEGFKAAASGGDLDVDMSEYGPKLQAYAGKRMAEQSAKLAGGNKEAGAKVAAEKAAMEGAKKTDSGLVYRVLEGADSTGASPDSATARVKVHYVGRLIDGTEFDSSVSRGEPATFGLNQVIKCWTEGVQMMKVGQKAELTCPSDIAYGDQGRPGIPPGATLIFEVELLEIVGADS